MPVGQYSLLRSGGGSGGPPPWAPAHGYHAKVRHIYFPDYNVYYDLRKGTYIYQVEARWVRSSQIPTGIRLTQLKNSRQVEIRIHTNNPQNYRGLHGAPAARKGKKGQR